MLTEKQKELLVFIHARVQETGVPPSFDEMKEALDLQSKSGIHRLITALEERGFIRRLPHRARAIEIIKLPEAMTEGGAPAPGFTPSVIEGSGRSAALSYSAPRRCIARVAPVGAADGPHRCRRADQRHPEPHPGHPVPAGPA